MIEPDKILMRILTHVMDVPNPPTVEISITNRRGMKIEGVLQSIPVLKTPLLGGVLDPKGPKYRVPFDSDDDSLADHFWMTPEDFGNLTLVKNQLKNAKFHWRLQDAAE